MSAVYSDQDRKLATEIAYSKEIASAYENSNHRDNPQTLEQLLMEEYQSDPNAQGDFASYVKKILPSVKVENGELCDPRLNWKISAVYDNNMPDCGNVPDLEPTGLYGCVIETGDNNAMVAFRGSEAPSEPDQMRLDWVNGDLRMLNNIQTDQQADVENFTRRNKDLLSKYDSIEAVGHSLGGNDAEHFTLTASKYGVNNVDRCTSMDGPGFSDEYLKAHRDEIAAAEGKLYRYKWSIVGSLLNDLPGENVTIAKVNDEVDKKHGFNIGERHPTSALDFDENGNVQPGKQDAVAFIGEKFSKFVDNRLPKPVGDFVVDIIGGALVWSSSASEAEKKTVMVIVGGLIITHPGISIGIAGGILVLGAGMVLAECGLEFLEEKLIPFLKDTCEDLKQWWDDTMGKFSDFFDSVMEYAGGMLSELRAKFDAGYRAAQYTQAHPVVRLHTQDLRNLAGRIQQANNRLGALDQRLDNLYKLARLRDLKALLYAVSADFKICYSTRLQNCTNYLNQTAESFESAEQKLAAIIN